MFFSAFLLLLGSIEDLKTGEIPEWISHSLIFGILIIGLLLSLSRWNPFFFATTLVNSIIFSIVSCVFFYTGQWGGGDVKLATGIGGLIALIEAVEYARPNMVMFENPISPLFVFWINMAIISVPYVIVYSVFLGLKSVRVKEKIGEYFSDIKLTLLFLFLLLSLPVSVGVFGFPFYVKIYFIVFFFTMLMVYLKLIEAYALRMQIPVSRLKLGDIVAEDVWVGGEKIASKRNIEGLTQMQVDEIKTNAAQGIIPPQIDVKWGVKFAPVLFLAVLATVYLGNLMEGVMLILLGI